MNRRLLLVCAGGLPEYSCDAALADRACIAARPHLRHERYRRKINQVALGPGSSYEKTELISFGTSTRHEESLEFSRTLGVEVTVGGNWNAFSASVKASYRQTETRVELYAVTFSREETKSETCRVDPAPNRTRLDAIYQSVTRFD